MDFEILVGKPRADGKVEVRDSRGGLQVCDNEEHARIYANGLSDGYNAAVKGLGVARWRYDN